MGDWAGDLRRRPPIWAHLVAFVIVAAFVFLVGLACYAAYMAVAG